MSKIAFNKVTWYSKAIALGVFLLLIIGGFWFGLEYGYLAGYVNGIQNSLGNGFAATSTTATNSALPEYYTNPAEWQTDTDRTGGFSIAYPIDFSTNEGAASEATQNWSLQNNNTSGDLFFTLTIPTLFEPQTNFADATLTVGSSKNATAVANCLAGEISGGPAEATSTQIIGGVAFTVFHGSDAGAGNLYNTTSYRTLHDDQCYAIEYTIHSSQLGNYPPEYNLKQFDPAPLTQVLDTIVGTFKFL